MQTCQEWRYRVDLCANLLSSGIHLHQTPTGKTIKQFEGSTSIKNKKEVKFKGGC